MLKRPFRLADELNLEVSMTGIACWARRVVHKTPTFLSCKAIILS